MAAVAIAISIRIIGILLIGALMVIPVMTAMQFARSFKQTVILSVLFSLSSVIAGLFASFISISQVAARLFDIRAYISHLVGNKIN